MAGHQYQIKNRKTENFLTEIMASETEFNEFVSFYGDDHKPSKKTELKRKAFENLAEIEIDEKCPVKGGKISKGIIKMAPSSKIIFGRTWQKGISRAQKLKINMDFRPKRS